MTGEVSLIWLSDISSCDWLWAEVGGRLLFLFFRSAGHVSVDFWSKWILQNSSVKRLLVDSQKTRSVDTCHKEFSPLSLPLKHCLRCLRCLWLQWRPHCPHDGTKGGYFTSKAALVGNCFLWLLMTEKLAVCGKCLSYTWDAYNLALMNQLA